MCSVVDILGMERRPERLEGSVSGGGGEMGPRGQQKPDPAGA